jgi:hypothetical protein
LELQEQEDDKKKKMVTSAFFINMVDALEMHGSRFDLIAIIASVGPAIPKCSFDPFFTREICLMDSKFDFFIFFANYY